MISAKASSDNVPNILMFGLSRENVRRLVAGQPIILKRSVHEVVPEGWEICLFFGETEREMAELFRKHGLITKDTQVKIDPRL